MACLPSTRPAKNSATRTRIEGSFWWVPLAVLVGAIVAESFSFRTAIRESNTVRGKQSWVKFVRSAKQPELPVILLEDFGALLGLAFALIGVGMTLLTGNGVWDAAGTAMIGLLLVAIAVVLALETKSLLVGESATQGGRRAHQGRHRGRRRPHHPPQDPAPWTGRTSGGGKDRRGQSSTGEQIATEIDGTEARIRAAVPIARVIYLEPDLQRTSALDDR